MIGLKLSLTFYKSQFVAPPSRHKPKYPSKLRSSTVNFRKMPSRTDDILKGFRVNWVNLRDNNNGKILWQGNMDISLGMSLLQNYSNNKIFIKPSNAIYIHIFLH